MIFLGLSLKKMMILFNLVFSVLLRKSSLIQSVWREAGTSVMFLNCVICLICFQTRDLSDLGLVLSFLNILSSFWVIFYLAGHPSKETIQELVCLFLTFSTVQGVFFSDYLIEFYVFFELSLVPLVIWILTEYTDDKKAAAIKFMIYTMLGSSVFLVALLYGFQQTFQLSSTIIELQKVPTNSLWVGLGLMLPFLIKIPLWPIHSWLPLAHTQAPTAGSMMLASVVLKIGAFGLLNVVGPLISKEIICTLINPLIFLSLMSLLWVAVVAYYQSDLKKIIAYSSIVHMSWIVMGYVLYRQSDDLLLWRAISFQLISHGVISIGLFLIAGLLSHRLHTREISAYRGLGTHSPIIARYLTFFMLANSALPGTSGFVAEFLITTKLYHYSPLIAAVAVLGVVSGLIMNLRYYAPLTYGPISKELIFSDTQDCSVSEHFLLGPLAALILLLGLYPDFILRFITSPGV